MPNRQSEGHTLPDGIQPHTNGSRSNLNTPSNSTFPFLPAPPSSSLFSSPSTPSNITTPANTRPTHIPTFPHPSAAVFSADVFSSNPPPITTLPTPLTSLFSQSYPNFSSSLFATTASSPSFASTPHATLFTTATLPQTPHTRFPAHGAAGSMFPNSDDATPSISNPIPNPTTATPSQNTTSAPSSTQPNTNTTPTPDVFTTPESQTTARQPATTTHGETAGATTAAATSTATAATAIPPASTAAANATSGGALLSSSGLGNPSPQIYTLPPSTRNVPWGLSRKSEPNGFGGNTTTYFTISAMEFFDAHSVEELRFGDYARGFKSGDSFVGDVSATAGESTFGARGGDSGGSGGDGGNGNGNGSGAVVSAGITPVVSAAPDGDAVNNSGTGVAGGRTAPTSFGFGFGQQASLFNAGSQTPGRELSSGVLGGGNGGLGAFPSTFGGVGGISAGSLFGSGVGTGGGGGGGGFGSGVPGLIPVGGNGTPCTVSLYGTGNNGAGTSAQRTAMQGGQGSASGRGLGADGGGTQGADEVTGLCCPLRGRSGGGSGISGDCGGGVQGEEQGREGLRQGVGSGGTSTGVPLGTCDVGGLQLILQQLQTTGTFVTVGVVVAIVVAVGALVVAVSAAMMVAFVLQIVVTVAVVRTMG